MKKMTAYLIALMLIVSCMCSAALADSAMQRTIILMTEYQQMGWGEAFQLGVLDADGTLWTYESSTRGEIPYEAEGLLAWAEASDQLEAAGAISHTKLSDIVSLVKTVPAQEVVPQSFACDAGTQTAYAVRKDRDGRVEIIVLGMAGDDTFENTDPAAQSLYKSMLSLFEHVKAFAGEKDVAPAGFAKADILSFCGYEGVDLTQYTLTAWANDCETGASETEPAMSAADIMRMTVIGKQNSMSTTGNTVTYCFTDAAGSTIAAFEFCNGLLVRPDGMYAVE